MKKFVRRYLSANVLPIWMILAMDVVMIGLSLLLAYALRYDFSSRVLDSATIVGPSETRRWTRNRIAPGADYFVKKYKCN